MGSHALSIGSIIHWKLVPIELVRGLVPVSIISTETLASQRGRKRTDTGIAIIVQQNDSDFLPFLDGSNNFLCHHKIASVTHHHVDFTIWLRHFSSKSTCNFITHTGISIFQMEALGITGTP